MTETGINKYGINDKRIYLLSIIKWALIGLFIRILIMPFTIDIDMFWINDIPHQLVINGTWDVYSFVRDNFWDRIGATNNPYYPPVTIFIISFFQFLLKPFMPMLNAWFQSYENFLHSGGGMFIQHMIIPNSAQIFRNLFFLKVPILVFDFGIGAIILKLIKDKKDSLFAYKLWMLNPVTLYAAFGYGQIDIYPTFFVVLSLWLASRGRPYLSMVSLGLGTLTKSYPLILIPIAAVFLSKRFLEQIKLLLTAIGTIAIFYLPFIISAGWYALISILPGGTIGTGFGWNLKSVLLRIFFIAGYALTVIAIVFNRKRNDGRAFGLETYFLITLLIFFSFQPIAERFYIWLTPLLILEALKDRKLFIMILFQLLALVLLRFQSAEQWAGIFSPLNPEYFMSRPFIYHFIAPFFSVIDLQRIAYKVFIVITLFMVCRIVRTNLKLSGKYATQD